MLYAEEVKEDIADLVTNVPAIDDYFNIVEKIGAGILSFCALFCYYSNSRIFSHISLI